MALYNGHHNNFINARPDYFKLENRNDNQSHRNEKPGNGDLEDIIKDIKQFKRKQGIK